MSLKHWEHNFQEALATPNPFSNEDSDSSECDCEDCKKQNEQDKIAQEAVNKTTFVPAPQPQLLPQPQICRAGPQYQQYVVVPAATVQDEKKEGSFNPFDYPKYLKCADFSKCSLEGWTTLQMNTVKGVFACLIGMNIIVTFFLNEYVAHMFFFYSYWGDISAFLACALQIRASQYPKTYQIPAMICVEMAWSFNLVIFPMFWTIEAPIEFPVLNWHKLHDVIWGIHYCTTHSWPILSCVASTYMTKNLTLVPEDKLIMFVAGLIYIYANWLGTKVEGAPMYPIADWKNVPLTIFLYFLMGCTQTLAYMKMAAWLNKKRPKKEEKVHYVTLPVAMPAQPVHQMV